jgi:protein TonB
VAKVDPTPAPASASAEAFDAGSLAQYRLQIISAARKYKRYPRVAMDNNWEGDVVVRMVVGANGIISELSVKSSSGHEVLDQQALDMFKRAKPLVQIPPALRGKEFTIELRAIYSLKDQESS